MEIKKVCVIGAGTMGNGITQVVAQAGYDTTMVDIKPEFLERGMNAIKGSLARVVKKGTITQADADQIVGRIKTTTDMKAGAGRVREHIEYVKFWPGVVYLSTVSFVFNPVLLPFFLDFIEIVIHSERFKQRPYQAWNRFCEKAAKLEK